MNTIKSLWKIEFVAAAATHTFLDYADRVEKEPELDLSQNSLVTAPIFLPFASSFPLGGAQGGLSWSRIRELSRPRTTALIEAALMPWGKMGYLRVSILDGGAMVYLRSSIKSATPRYDIQNGWLMQTFTAELGAPSYPTFVVPTLSTTTRAVGVSGTILNPTITGGLASYVVTLATGALPAGYTVSSAGVITGTPTTAGSYAWTLAITDARGAVMLYDYTFTVT
jgi:hypothetical protein